jgi:ABC-type dipeptide/oligopeptide/nickel transport system permease subunit
LLGISLWALILLGLASGYFPEQTDTFLSSLIETMS